MGSRWKYYLVFALLGATAATAIELFAVATERWVYHERMPIIAALGVGLWPFLQLTLLVPAAVGLAHWWSGRRSRTLAAPKK